MSLRAGIVITGTEVLTGVISDRNGPWLSERLRELGVEHAHTLIVGDRPADMRGALEFLRAQGMDLIVTSGGLGPTADDLTAAVVGEFQGREMALDKILEERIAEILRPLEQRIPRLDLDALRVGTRKQAIVPRGSSVLEPVGTAPGLVVPPTEGERPTIVVLPGPPSELQPMWESALTAPALTAVLARAGAFRVRILRLFGIPESEIAQTLRVALSEGIALWRLEITTCLRRGEIEIVTVYEPDAEETYAEFEAVVRARHADTLFSDDGSTIDEQVAELLRGGHTIATAESCTGGMLAARLIDPPGASAYVLGAIVAYANEVKVSQAGVEPALIEAHGAVSTEVAQALADGVRARLGADIGVGITGIAGPSGGSQEKPVGLVCLSIAGPGDAHLTRQVTLPGGRADIRERASTVAMHLLRRALLGIG